MGEMKRMQCDSRERENGAFSEAKRSIRPGCCRKGKGEDAPTGRVARQVSSSLAGDEAADEDVEEEEEGEGEV